MTARKLKILLLFDLSIPLTPEDFPEYLKTDDWKSEANVLRVLRKLGHDVKPFGVHDDLRGLFDEVQDNRPDLVFNLCEAFAGNRDFEPHIAAFFELVRIRYTGAGVTSLRVCKDKGLTKKILSYHRVRVPRFLVSHRQRPLRGLGKFIYPAFIKPLQMEASEGISQVSLVENEEDALDRLHFIHDRLKTDAIIEEYIVGRELYVSILGNDRLSLFPPRELFFKEVADDEPKFATFRAKWDDAYRKKWGIDTSFAGPIAPDVLKKMTETCKKIYRLLQIRGYGRIDLRLTAEGEVVFIEANPNPSIAREDDFAQSAERGGVDYESLIARILALAEK